jgi:single-stranded-DNA-specific exonuclease
MKAGRAVIEGVDLRRHLDLVAVGTIADIVPLEGENRILARHGLARLNRYPRLGLSELLNVAGVDGDVDSFHIGFVIGPRLNAAGRLGDADRAMQLLLTEDLQVARALAKELDETNRERRNIEQAIQAEAQAQIDAAFDPATTFGIALGQKGWHQGTVGIVASRLCSRYFRPSVVIGFDENGFGRGSCRSIPDLDILGVLEECSAHLLSFGGHTMAAGLSLDIGHLEAFAKQFNAVCAERLAGRELRPVQKVDAWIQFGETDWRLLESLNELRPFGMGNPTPTWGARGVSLAGPPLKVGKDARHWKLSLAQGGSVHEAVAFNMGQYPIPDGNIDVLFQARPNTFRGGNAIELHIQDLRAAAEQ